MQRSWLKSAINTKEPHSVIGLKYCGGCNPNYERGDLARRLMTDLPQIRFVPYRDDGLYELVIVICGCYAECFSFSCNNSLHGIYRIHDPMEYGLLKNRIMQKLL